MKLGALLVFVVVPAVAAAQQSGYVTVSDGARLFYRTSGQLREVSSEQRSRLASRS